MTIFLLFLSVAMIVLLLTFFVSQYVRFNFRRALFIVLASLVITAILILQNQLFTKFLTGPQIFYFILLFFLLTLILVGLFAYFFERRGFGAGRNVIRRLTSASTTKKMCLFTFDDGPSSQWTPPIIEILSKNMVWAIFFTCGESAKKNPDILKKLDEQGFEVAVHSYSHKCLPLLSSANIRKEIGDVVETIQAITGKAPRYFRPPWGLYNKEVLDIAESFGLRAILWSRSTRDWLETNPKKILLNATRGIHSGEIILLHDACKEGASREFTVQALPWIIEKLNSDRFELGEAAKSAFLLM